MSRPMSMCRRIRRGFTLIELLVVIALIGLLISLLLPSLGNARKTAWSVICQSNLRQLGISIRSYLDEQKDERATFMDLHNGPSPQFFYHVGVVDTLQPYLSDAGQKPFDCPAAKGLASVRDPANIAYLQQSLRVYTLPLPGFINTPPVTKYTEYFFNDSEPNIGPSGTFQTPYGVSNQRLRLIKNPQWVVWAMDAIDEHPRHFGPRTSRNPNNPDPVTTGKDNLLFGDNSVKSMDYVDYQDKPDPAGAPAPFYNWGHLYYR